MPVERRTEGVGLALWWTRQRDRNYLRKRAVGRPLGPGMEGPRVEPGKPEGRRSSLSGGENRKERPCTRLERASGDSNRRILKTVRPVVWEGAGAQPPALDPIHAVARGDGAGPGVSPWISEQVPLGRRGQDVRIVVSDAVHLGADGALLVGAGVRLPNQVEELGHRR